MKGASMILMVLFIVLTIPLYSVSIERNSEIKLSAISTINSKEEVIREYVPAISYEIVAIKPDEIVIPLPKEVGLICDNDVSKDFNSYYNKISMGGGRRIKSGRH